MRAETGPMEFEDDWCGVFIRGDNALMRYVPMLKSLRDKLKPEDDTFQGILEILCLDDLISVLSLSNQHQDIDVQRMKRFEDCVK